MYLRNEFHFSGVHGAMNSLLIFTFISLYCLLKNHQGGHIYQQTENLHTVCVQTAERRRRLQRPV